jgi:glucose/arabinose dehydrogenase
MQSRRFLKLFVPLSIVVLASLAFSQSIELRTGATAVRDDWKSDNPGVRRLIKPSDLPAPPPATAADGEKSVANIVKLVEPPQGALPKVPDGFAVEVFASGFKQPRTLRIAPNGDIFLSESGTGRVLVFRAGAGGGPAKAEVFAENLDRPYGIIFPAARQSPVHLCGGGESGGPYPYHSGAVKAAAPPDVVIANIPTKRHWTRDLAVSRMASACSSPSARGPMSGAT